MNHNRTQCGGSGVKWGQAVRTCGYNITSGFLRRVAWVCSTRGSKRQAATAASSQLLRRAIAAATRQRFPQRREVPPPPANVVPGSPRPGCAKLERGTSWSLRRRPILQFRGVSHSSYLDQTIYCHHF